MMIIYKAYCAISKKAYIGKTKYTLDTRVSGHISDSKLDRYKNIKFYRALNKYGVENFKWSIIETCKNEKSLNAREIYWIKKLSTQKNGYNSTSGGDGLSNPSTETRLKMSMAAKRTRNGKGHKVPLWLREKISIANTGVSKPKTKLYKHVDEIFYLYNNGYTQYEIADKFNVHQASIYRILNRKLLYARQK